MVIFQRCLTLHLDRANLLEQKEARRIACGYILPTIINSPMIAVPCWRIISVRNKYSSTLCYSLIHIKQALRLSYRVNL